MTGRTLHAGMIARSASLFERAADLLAEEIGDEVVASGLLLAWAAYTESRWGIGAVHDRMMLGVAEIEARARNEGSGG